MNQTFYGTRVLRNPQHTADSEPRTMAIETDKQDGQPFQDSILSRLPFELRSRIFQYALAQEGTIELQCPVWASKPALNQSLFKVCSAVRDEALEAYYQTNTFLWIVDPTAAHRSDPTSYPSFTSYARPYSTIHSKSSDDLPSSHLTPSLPWQYPYLGKYLRNLQLNIYLPSNLIGDLEAARAWSDSFPRMLERVVIALDHGMRLTELNVLFTAKRFNTRIALAGEQLRALASLTNMEVKGTVNVQTRYDFKECRKSIGGLNLERRMKA